MSEQTPAEIALDILWGTAGNLNALADKLAEQAAQLYAAAGDIKSVVPTLKDALPKVNSPA